MSPTLQRKWLGFLRDLDTAEALEFLGALSVDQVRELVLEPLGTARRTDDVRRLTTRERVELARYTRPWRN